MHSKTKKIVISALQAKVTPGFSGVFGFGQAAGVEHIGWDQQQISWKGNKG